MVHWAPYDVQAHSAELYNDLSMQIAQIQHDSEELQFSLQQEKVDAERQMAEEQSRLQAALQQQGDAIHRRDVIQAEALEHRNTALCYKFASVAVGILQRCEVSDWEACCREALSVQRDKFQVFRLSSKLKVLKEAVSKQAEVFAKAAQQRPVEAPNSGTSPHTPGKAPLPSPDGRPPTAPKGAPPPGKGAGKGAPPLPKGPPAKAPGGSLGPVGKAPVGPPPKGGPKAKAKAGAAGAGPVLPKSNGLVNINWRESVPPRTEELAKSRSQVLGPLDCDELPETDVVGRDTVFTSSHGAQSSSNVNEVTPLQLRDWFSKTPLEVSGSSASSASASANTGTCVLENQLLMSVLILMQKFRMKAQAADLVAAMRSGILCCNLNQEVLQGLASVLAAHTQAGHPIRQYVQAHGEASLERCASPDEHRLIHVVSQIPGVEHRIRCSIFHGTWMEASHKSKKDLMVLHEGMRVIVSKRQAHQFFFNTALRLGNMLNQDSRAPVASQGSTFRLSSLSKMLELRLQVPGRSQGSFLHAVLALMEPSHVETLASGYWELCAARDLKSGGVYQRCTELLDGYREVKRLLTQVPQQKRHRMIPSAGSPTVPSHRGPGYTPSDGAHPTLVKVEELDPEDHFREHMRGFLGATEAEAKALAKLLQDVFTCYREQAEYFADPQALWPPPMKDGDSTKDIFDIFSWFADTVSRAAKDLDRLGLREDIKQGHVRPASPSPAARGSATPRAAVATPRAAVAASPGKASPARPPLSVISTPSGSESRDAAVLRRLGSARSQDTIGTPRVNASQRTSALPKAAPGTPATCNDDAQSDVSDWGSVSPRKSKATTSSSSRGLFPAAVSKPAMTTSTSLPAVVSKGHLEHTALRRLQDRQSSGPTGALASTPVRTSVLTTAAADTRDIDDEQSDVSDWEDSPRKSRPPQSGEKQTLLQPSPPARPAMARTSMTSSTTCLAKPSGHSSASPSPAMHIPPARAVAPAVAVPPEGKAALGPPPTRRPPSRSGSAVRQSSACKSTPQRSGTLSPPPCRLPAAALGRSEASSPPPSRVMSSPAQGSDMSPLATPAKFRSSPLPDRRKSISDFADRVCEAHVREALREFSEAADASESDEEEQPEEETERATMTLQELLDRSPSPNRRQRFNRQAAASSCGGIGSGFGGAELKAEVG